MARERSWSGTFRKPPANGWCQVLLEAALKYPVVNLPPVPPCARRTPESAGEIGAGA
jgi:hypothetical protein